MARDQTLDGSSDAAFEGIRAFAAGHDVPGGMGDPATPLLRVASDYLVALQPLPFAERDLSEFGQVLGFATDPFGDRSRRLAGAR